MNNSKRVIALGFFDGVHLGHAALINKVKEIASEKKLSPSIISFDTHPDELVDGRHVELLSDYNTRKWMLISLFDISDIILLHFNRSMMSMNWKSFLDMLVENYDISWIVAGYDFTFGYKGEGNCEKLVDYCFDHSIGVDIIQPVKVNGTVVSSTLIRKQIIDGKIRNALEYLGHPFYLSGEIVSGYHVGTSLGYPTININIPYNVIVPKHGVYATVVCFENNFRYHSITNIGTRPTFSDMNQVSVETFIFDFSDNIYGKTVTVEFYDYLREEIKFTSSEKLVDQIGKDIFMAKQLLKSI